MSMAGGKVRQATLGALLQWMAGQPEIRRIGRMPNLANARAVFKDVSEPVGATERGAARTECVPCGASIRAGLSPPPGLLA